MRHITLLLVLLMAATLVHAQSTPMDSLQNKVMKFMEFVDSYDNGSPESLKKAKYSEAIDAMTDGQASEQTKKEAYGIIDAYIKADKALEKGEVPEQKDKHKDEWNEMLKNSEDGKKGVELIHQQYSMWSGLSYPEFEKKVRSIAPTSSTKDIKQAYNEMHKTDGKQVEVTAADSELTQVQKQVQAIETLKNPKDYEEARRAMIILKPGITESEMKAAWAKYKK